MRVAITGKLSADSTNEKALSCSPILNEQRVGQHATIVRNMFFISGSPDTCKPATIQLPTHFTAALPVTVACGNSTSTTRRGILRYTTFPLLLSAPRRQRADLGDGALQPWLRRCRGQARQRQPQMG